MSEQNRELSEGAEAWAEKARQLFEEAREAAETAAQLAREARDAALAGDNGSAESVSAAMSAATGGAIDPFVFPVCNFRHGHFCRLLRGLVGYTGPSHTADVCNQRNFLSDCCWCVAGCWCSGCWFCGHGFRIYRACFGGG